MRSFAIDIVANVFLVLQHSGDNARIPVCPSGPGILDASSIQFTGDVNWPHILFRVHAKNLSDTLDLFYGAGDKNDPVFLNVLALSVNQFLLLLMIHGYQHPAKTIPWCTSNPKPQL